MTRLVIPVKSNEIRCGGGGMLLHDGTFAFYIELSIAGNQFEFESIDTFEKEDEMYDALEAVMAEFPKAIAEAATTRDFNLVEEFCQKWRIAKVRLSDPTGESEPPLLH